VRVNPKVGDLVKLDRQDLTNRYASVKQENEPTWLILDLVEDRTISGTKRWTHKALNLRSNDVMWFGLEGTVWIVVSSAGQK